MWPRFLSLWRQSAPPLLINPSHDLSPRVAAPVLSHLEQIQQLQPKIERLLIQEFELGELVSRLCPVLLADQSVTVFAIEEHQVGDAIDALHALIQKKGYQLAKVPCYVVGVTLLLELVRTAPSSPMANQAAGSGALWAQADLFNAFLEIVRWGVLHHATDIHINILTASPYSEVRFSIAGRYSHPPKFQGISTRFLLDMMAVVWMSIRGGNGAVFDPHKEQQGSLHCEIEGKSVMLRWGSLAAELGPSICLRILQRQLGTVLPDLASLGYLPAQQLQLENSLLGDGGAVVFSGAVGSGKSTTLAALIAQLPAWRKLVSLEDPVEYLISNAVQVALSRDLFEESHQVFGAKLRALKRAAMTDVLLGEIRDVETGRAFTDLSSSGVRLYTTVHAASAALVPARLHSDFIGVSMDLLTAPSVIKLLVHQCLLPRLCSYCAIPLITLTDYPPQAIRRHHPFSQWIRQLKRLMKNMDLSQVRVRCLSGCEHCFNTELPELKGWQGRVVSAEILDPALYPDYLVALLARQPVLPVLLQAGWKPLRFNALEQVSLGRIDPFDLERYFDVLDSPAWQGRWPKGRPC
ncbi:ATPase, T2SS/T4P/T4SS family [Paenalcaligenes hominis]|uniref:Type II secretory ATPase GspE/PulE/Tfp pilus assembly ATPase PilB-like protein n=1 Tax=Paenalcaligenes hominis TaxID=643674 RepID=A0ABX0WMI3_9BURK|nr:ATPase, T2SS/T4P/T4SS family [Paenalcaligenes hominis]NJB64024.1 type II secretory ATPase GspE/PulE/Tfp pilus assembly ATPase PilB-like protein [Paenalcaligenes hominis]GGE62513.1 general secretion pathway protein [Paenalcaligenes hominis]